MAIFFGVVVGILVVVFGVASIMQSYASAQQARAVVETAQVAQMATAANVIVIAVMALVLVLILAGIVYLALKLTRRPQQLADRRQNRLEAGRRYGKYIKQLREEKEALSLPQSQPTDEILVIADDDQVQDYLNTLFDETW
jgi:NADH:ubiquinone oxidoreductase subunit 3 (subunit A)